MSLASCETGYVVTNDNRVLTGKIDLRCCYSVIFSNQKNYKLGIRTKINEKKRKYRFNIKKIKYVKIKSGKLSEEALQGEIYFPQDSTILVPLKLANGITYLCWLLKSKNNASIYYLFWLSGYASNYPVNEFILISNDSIIEINPAFCAHILPDGKPFYYECKSCQNQNKEVSKISSAESGTAYRKGKVHKQHRNNDDDDYEPENNDILCFINNRYHQQFEMKDFKTDEKGMNWREKRSNRIETTRKMLNYILDKEAALEQQNKGQK